VEFEQCALEVGKNAIRTWNIFANLYSKEANRGRGSKKVIVFDPLLMGHVIRRMCSGRVRIFNRTQQETL